MKEALYLAWRYLAYHRVKTLILVTSITLIVFLPVGLNVLVGQSAAELTARAEATPLLVGAKGTLGGMRGTVYRYGDAKLIVTYHPAACLRNPGYKRPVWEDMQLLAREYQTA